MINFFDTVLADKSSVRTTTDGYLVASVRCARTGIQEYLGDEVGRPDMPIVRVYRPESEVFHKDSLATYAHKPATNDHPAQPVNSTNHRDLAVGIIGDEVVRDGDHVRVPLMLTDQSAIDDYHSGKADLSMGYSAEIVFEPGVTDSGDKYDAIQRNIRNNHIALVDHGRAGSTRIGDSRSFGVLKLDAQKPTPKGGRQMAENLRKVIVDGLTVETTDQGAEAISKLQTQLADANSAHQKELADRDADIAKKEAEIDSLKEKVLSDADLDKRVQERADLIGTAKAISDMDYSGKTDAEIRKAAVVAKLGDAAIDSKPDAYIEARFDILADESKADPVRSAIVSGTQQTAVNDSHAAYLKRLTRQEA